MSVHGDRPAPPKGGLVLPTLFVTVRVGDLADDYHGRRRGQLKPLSHLPISAALEGQPVPEVFSERNTGEPVRRRIQPLQPSYQLGGVRRVESDGLNTVHQYIISISLHPPTGATTSVKGITANLPHHEHGVTPTPRLRHSCATR